MTQENVILALAEARAVVEGRLSPVARAALADESDLFDGDPVADEMRLMVDRIVIGSVLVRIMHEALQ